MRKSIPFELFGPNQTIYFDILRLGEMETLCGTSIVNIIRNQDAGINFCLNGLTVGMKHHYHRATPAFFAEKIEAHLDAGGKLDDIAVPVIKAIMASGIFGKALTDDEEDTGKNG